MSKKVAVVTGSNKGIGFAIVRGLCKQFDGDVYLTSRSEESGKDALEKLKQEGLSPKYHQLDIDDPNSRKALKEFLEREYQGLDILVNNAGMAYKAASTAPFSEQAEVTMKTNFFSTVDIFKEMLPILRPQARVVNVGSFTSLMVFSRLSDTLKKKLKGLTTIEQVEEEMNEFVKLAKTGTHKEHGWADWAYATTKLGITLVAPMQQAMLDKTGRSDMIINAADPGYVQTDMTGGKGSKTPDEGADTPLYLALLPSGTKSPRGKYVSDRKIGELK